MSAMTASPIGIDVNASSLLLFDIIRVSIEEDLAVEVHGLCNGTAPEGEVCHSRSLLQLDGGVDAHRG